MFQEACVFGGGGGVPAGEGHVREEGVLERSAEMRTKVKRGAYMEDHGALNAASNGRHA